MTDQSKRDAGRGAGSVIARAAHLMADNHQAVWDDPAAREYFLSDARALAAAGLLRTAPEPDPAAPEGRDIYVHIGRGDVAATWEASEFVYVDLDSGGNPIGVEILGVIGIDVDGKRVLPALEPSGDVVETVAADITVEDGEQHG